MTKAAFWTKAQSLVLFLFKLFRIFNHSAVTQTRIKISSWNFLHKLIIYMCKFDKKFLAVTESTYQLQFILPKTLNFSSGRIFWDIQKRKKWWGSRPIKVTSRKKFSTFPVKWHFEISWTSHGSTFTMSTYRVS